MELIHIMDVPHGSGMGQSQAVVWGTPWLQCGTDTLHGGHDQVTPPLGTYFICLTIVLFPDSPAPMGTKHGSWWCPCHGHSQLSPVLAHWEPWSLVPGMAAGTIGSARSMAQGV